MFNNNNLELFTLLPHRGIAYGKSRLAEILSDAARAQLNRQLLERTLRIVTGWTGAQHCIVVSPCDEALSIASAAAAVAVRDEGAGLNAALAQAAARAAVLGAQRLLVLPCDLPLLSREALDVIAGMAQQDADVVIAPDCARAGTNALLVEAAVREFAFGEQSFARHRALAAVRGARVLLCERPEFAFDLDTPDDYRQWRRAETHAPVV